MSSALVLLSGGLDSAVALGWASRKYSSLQAITFEYHLRPFREKLATYRLLQTFPARLIEVAIPYLKEAGDFDAKLKSIVPEGYIPNRNMIFYSIAIHFAELSQCSTIIGGHTAADEEAFPDAGTSFLQQLQDLANQALQINKIRIELPLVKLTKLQVLQSAIDLSVPLDDTWSCYSDGMVPCEDCVSCTERSQAFEQLGVRDPLCTT